VRTTTGAEASGLAAGAYCDPILQGGHGERVGPMCLVRTAQLESTVCLKVWSKQVLVLGSFPRRSTLITHSTL
jgi:hypothetical protein